ncbi:hypothetical protein RND71_032311 [Anisodus tanguticus]|uniref:Uncharacterized protein n=1 Tax=Anisodus tanguticus TaxID=243964 RepID=A0AAE1V442_9SOLA|nr:hypothetical protein RND71_032311 [Anisodus tanguticus]
MAFWGDQMEKIKLHQNYPNHWQTDLMRATQSDPQSCCFTLWAMTIIYDV